MEITPDHPVYVEGKGWLWAENLVVGDRLRRSDGGFAKVLAVERVRLAEPELVYNFTVKGPHTYFVLEVGVLVHNAGVTCAFVKSGNPWRNEKGQFAKTPDFDEEMGVFTTPDVSRELKGQIVDRPIAELDPITGKPVPLPNKLERKGGVWYPEEPRWGQGEFSHRVTFPVDGEWKEMDITEAVERLGKSGQYPGEMLVFRKTSSMQEPNWRMMAYDRHTGEIIDKAQLPADFDPARYYTGDYANLPDNLIIVLNNRTYTLSNLVPLENDIVVPIYWASRQEIEALSYQSSAIEMGTKIRAKRPHLSPQPEVVVPSLR